MTERKVPRAPIVEKGGWLDRQWVLFFTGLAKDVAGAVGGSVSSVFGRSGAVVAAASDYDASEVDNDSTVAGAFVSDALDQLDTDIGTNTTNISTNTTDIGNRLVTTNNLSDVTNAATSFSNIKQDASTTATGVLEIATQAEVDTGTDTTRVVTPDTLANYSGLGGGDLLAANNLSDVANAVTSLANLDGCPKVGHDGALTIASGNITIPASDKQVLSYTVDTQGGAATDDLDVILGGVAGQLLVLTSLISSRDTTVKDSANIRLKRSADFTLTGTDDTILLQCFSVNIWIEVSRTTNNDTSGGVDLVSTNNLSDVASATTSATNLGLGTGDTPDFTGVTFGGTGSTLDNYEEAGSFTPTIVGSSTAGTPTYTSQVGNYTIIGNKVTIQLRVIWTALGSAAGSIRVGGLPFTVAAQGGGFTGNAALSATEWAGLAMPTGKILMPMAQANTTYITLNMGDDTNAVDEMDETEATAAGQMYISGTYFT